MDLWTLDLLCLDDGHILRWAYTKRLSRHLDRVGSGILLFPSELGTFCAFKHPYPDAAGETSG